MKKQCGLTNAETVDLQTTIRSPSPSQRAQIKWAAIHRQQQLKHRIHMHQGIKTIYQTRWRTLWLNLLGNLQPLVVVLHVSIIHMLIPARCKMHY